MNKNIRQIAIVALIVVVVVGGLGYWYYKSKQKVPVASAGYITMKASRMNLSVNIQGTGTVIGDSKNVASSTNGQLQEFSLKVGDRVKSGDKIGSLSTDQLQTSVAKAQNNVNKQKIQLDNLNNSLKSAQNQLATYKADLANAQGQLATANPNEVKALNDKINTLQNQITSQNNNIVNYQNQISTQNINISDAQNDLKTAQNQLTQTTITSPIDGIVTTVNNSNGDTVQLGKAIVTIINPSSFKIKISIDELDIAKVKTGQIAKISFGALKDKNFTGKVSEIGLVGTTSNNVTTYEVIVTLDSIEGVQLGMTATVNIEVENKENALVIPAEALVEKNGKKYVMEPLEGNKTPGTQTKDKATDKGKIQQGQSSETGITSNENKEKQSRGNNTQNRTQRGTGQVTTGEGKLVEIQIGLQNENYVEAVSGVSEGQSVLVALPKTTSGTSTNQKQGFGGFGGGGLGGGMTGGNQGGSQRQGGSSGTK